MVAGVMVAGDVMVADRLTERDGVVDRLSAMLRTRNGVETIDLKSRGELLIQ